MSAAWERSYESHADFYSDVYGQHVSQLAILNTTGAALLEVEQTAGDWSDAPTPDLILGCLMRGPTQCRLRQGGRSFSGLMRPGQFVLVPPNTGSEILVDSPHALRILAVPYQRLCVLANNNALSPDGDFGDLSERFFASEPIRRLLDNLALEAATQSPHGSLLVDGALIQLAALLLRLRDGPVQTSSSRLAPWQLLRVQKFLEERMEGDVTLTEASAVVGLSEAHFSRAFKASTGLPPWRWLAERRVERARQLLTDTRLSLTDVAQLVGYSGQSTFGEAFRRATGMTPGQYRQEALR